MHHQTGSFTAGDDVQLFTQQWVPERPSAALILSHGYAEHSGRYTNFAEFLAENGVAVYALDHRGHGRSEGERANIGVFRQYVTDLVRFTEAVREKHPKPPRVLLGHSMGGAIAAQLALEHPHKVDALILSSPFLKNANDVPPLLLSASGLVSRLLPALPTIKIDTDLLSRDKEVVAAYNADPLVYTGGTKARLGKEMLDAGEYVLQRAGSLELPLLVLLGTTDGIAHPEGGRTLYERARSEDKTLNTYDGFYHEILNEIGKEAVYKDVLEWLRARLPAAPDT